MAQGYSGYNILENSFTIKDSPNLDAFSRLRISNPLTLFSSQFTYNLNPLLFEQITGTGGTIAHSSTNRCAEISITSAPLNSSTYMQSFEYLPYQPSKSQLVFVTFNMKAYSSNVLKFAGLSDGVNGIEFQNTGALNRLVIYSGTGNGNQIVNQNSWNLDKLDGTGESGHILNISKIQILVIDFQALYSGRVRVGFDINGTIIYCHEFLHANLAATPYLQTANLPVRCGVTATAASATGSLDFICSAVVCEGGTEDPSLFGYNFTASTGLTAATIGLSSWVHVLSIRPRLTFNSITNRIKFLMTDLDITNTGNGDIYWQLCVGQSYTTAPTSWNNINSTYSAMEFSKDTAAVFTGTNEIVIDSGIIPKSSGGKGQPISVGAFSKYPITLDQAGAVRELGTLTLKVYGIAASNVHANLKFKEIR